MPRPTPAAPTTILPCPVELVIEMDPESRLVFVSDLHLSGGGPTSDFAAGSELVQLLASPHEHPGQVVPVLGGDILAAARAAGRPRARCPQGRPAAPCPGANRPGGRGVAACRARRWPGPLQRPDRPLRPRSTRPQASTS